VYIQAETRTRFDAGLSVREAALDISLRQFDSWGDAERIAINVDTLYREFSGSRSPVDNVALFALMAEVRKDQRA